MIMFKQYADAETVNIHGEPFCNSIADYAEADEKAAKWVDLLVASGPVAALIAASIPMALQFGANHRRIPTGAQGVIPPEVLEMRFMRRMDEQKREAEREAAEFAAEMAEYRNEDRAREANET